MKHTELYHTPPLELYEETGLFEGDHSVSVSDKEKDANYWMTLRYITPCQKVFQIEITTFKKELGPEFFDQLQDLVAKHSTI